MFVANPDFEKPGDANEDNVYEVTVVVEDSDDNTAELAVRVEVSNVNEAGDSDLLGEHAAGCGAGDGDVE